MSDQDVQPMPSRGFAKLDCGIVDSTIWMLDHDALRVWICLLAKCDALGVVRASVPALAYLCRVDLRRFEEIIAILEAPDAYSRTGADEGRRLQRIEGGFVLLNYLRYRELAQRKSGSHAGRQAAYRARLAERDRVTGDATPSRVTQKEKQKEEGDGEAVKKSVAPPALPAGLDTPAFRQAWAEWLGYRRERKIAPYVNSSLARQFKRLAKMGEARAIAAIENSITQGSQGIYEATGAGRKPTGSAVICAGSSDAERAALRNLGNRTA